MIPQGAGTAAAVPVLKKTSHIACEPQDAQTENYFSSIE